MVHVLKFEIDFYKNIYNQISQIIVFDIQKYKKL